MKNLQIFFRHYWRVLAVIFLPLILTSCGEGKCGIPGDPYFYQCFYYYTDDMTETKVVFNKGVNTTKSFTFSIPKAFIISALPYAEDEVPVLPDEIEPHSLTLLVTYPSGVPLKVNRNKNEHENYYTVNIYGNYGYSNVGYESLCESLTKKPIVLVGKTSVYNHYETPKNCPRASEYIANNPAYGRAIYCPSLAKDSKIHYKCKHSIRLRQGIESEIALPDFRSNGGLLIAEQKVAFLLRTLCPMIGCDAKYTDYFYNLESK